MDENNMTWEDANEIGEDWAFEAARAAWAKRNGVSDPQRIEDDVLEAKFANDKF